MGPARSGRTIGDTVKVTSRQHAGLIMSPADAAAAVIEVVRRGGLAVVPLDVSYAFLGATRDAIERIYALKLRPGSKPCPMLASWEHFQEASAATPERIAAIARVDEAGLPVGLVTSTKWDGDIAKTIPGDVVDKVAKDGKMALFINMGGLSNMLLSEADRIGLRLFGSSANISGAGNSFRLDEVPEAMLEQVDIKVEGDTCRYVNAERMASSIVDVDDGVFTRRGILADEIEEVMEDTGGAPGGC